MNLAQVNQSLQYVVDLLNPIIQQNIILLQNNEISWNNYKKGIFRNTYYPLEYQWHIDNHQYSILLKDQSFFQFYYKFKDGALFKAKLTYYPKPIAIEHEVDELNEAVDKAAEMDDELMFDHFHNVIEQIDSLAIYPSNTSHMRIDFDLEAKSHSKSHIQFSGMNQIRIPADFYPLPYAFVQLICNSFSNSFFSFTENNRAIAHASGNHCKYEHGNGLIFAGHTT